MKGCVVQRQMDNFCLFVFFSIEDEGMGLRTIKCLAGICENNIPVVIPPNMQ